MLVIPAIDLRGGRCVRLRQGDYGQETVFGDDPVAMARRWVDQGARHLHLVDLDGAREGRPVNQESIEAIVKSASVPCELGGGLREEAHIQAALGWGVERVVIGTRALKSPDWFAEMCGKFPGKLLLGLDAKQGRVATDGWLEVSESRAVDVARRFQHLPLAGLIYTDISRDGMLAGPNLEAIAEVVTAVSQPVIASGGVTTLEDVRRLAHVPVSGCIIGRALYEGTLKLAEAIRIGET